MENYKKYLAETGKTNSIMAESFCVNAANNGIEKMLSKEKYCLNFVVTDKMANGLANDFILDKNGDYVASACPGIAVGKTEAMKNTTFLTLDEAIKKFKI